MMVAPIAHLFAGTVQLPPTGGSGGYRFDTGRNLSGVNKVKIEAGTIDGYTAPALKRIQFLFHDERQGSVDLVTNSSKFGKEQFAVTDKKGAKTYIYNVPAGHKIIKALVWSNTFKALSYQTRTILYVGGVQFLTDKGEVSPMFGRVEGDAQPTVYAGLEEADYLVGMYGRYDSVLNSVGFTFYSQKSHDKAVGVIPSSVITGAEFESVEKTIEESNTMGEHA